MAIGNAVEASINLIREQAHDSENRALVAGYIAALGPAYFIADRTSKIAGYEYNHYTSAHAAVPVHKPIEKGVSNQGMVEGAVFVLVGASTLVWSAFRGRRFYRDHIAFEE